MRWDSENRPPGSAGAPIHPSIHPAPHPMVTVWMHPVPAMQALPVPPVNLVAVEHFKLAHSWDIPGTCSKG